MADETFAQREMQIASGHPVRFALIGCGRIAQKHLDALEARHERVKLAAVCDADHAGLEATRESMGVPGYSLQKEALEGTDAECVVLCTRSGSHSQFSVAWRHQILEASALEGRLEGHLRLAAPHW